MDNENIKNLALEWCLSDNPNIIPGNYYCVSRDVFLARLDNLAVDLRANGKTGDAEIFMVTAMAGEIGNNSFDHNLGDWPDIPGIFFDWQINSGAQIILADRGRGLLATLKKIKPEISSHQEALKTAFFERISGRAPENRGNGLKFVRQGVKSTKAHLVFFTGDAKAELNQEFSVAPFDKNIRGCLAVIETKKYEN